MALNANDTKIEFLNVACFVKWQNLGKILVLQTAAFLTKKLKPDLFLECYRDRDCKYNEKCKNNKCVPKQGNLMCWCLVSFIFNNIFPLVVLGSV